MIRNLRGAKAPMQRLRELKSKHHIPKRQGSNRLFGGHAGEISNRGLEGE